MNNNATLAYDVIVVGFGTAGAVAAIAAARHGAKVLVLEKTSYAGGTQSGGGIPGFYGGPKPTGLTREIDELVKAAAVDGAYGGELELRKLILEREALAAGAQICYEAAVYAVAVTGQQVTGVSWVAGGVARQASCYVVIDSTAEAVICRLAGCDMLGGRHSDGLYNTFTNTFLASNGKKVGALNFDAGRIDQYHAESFSQTMLETNDVHVHDDYSALGGGNHRVVPSDLPGIREGVRVLTEKVLTAAEVLDQSLPEQIRPIAWVYTNLDTHTNDLALESELFQDWLVGASMWATCVWCPIVRENLVPRGWQGLLAAARHLGVDHDIAQAARMNGPMGQVGEAAGVMAAMAAREKHRDCLKIPLATLLAALPEVAEVSVEQEIDRVWTEAEVRAGLESDQPGLAKWAARRQRMVAPLLNWLTESAPGSHLRRHSAMTLALLDDSACLAELRQMAVERDDFTPRTSRHSNHARGYAAIYLLGRLRDVEAVPLLLEVLQDDTLDKKYECHTHAVMALVKIGQTYPRLRHEIAAALRAQAENQDWQLFSRLKETKKHVPIEQLFRLEIAKILREWGVPNNIAATVRSLLLNAHDKYLATKKLQVP